MGKRKNDTSLDAPSFDEAVKKYKAESGSLFKQPAREFSTYERQSWLLCDQSGLVCILSPKGLLFHNNLAAHFQQIAETINEH